MGNSFRDKETRLTYVIYILMCVAAVFTVSSGGGGEYGWDVRLIGLATIAIVLGIFVLICFLLKTDQRVLYALLITIGVILVAVVFFVILESIIGPIAPWQ